MADIGGLRASGGRLEWALGAFVAACFFLPTAPAYALVFYVAVLPCLAVRVRAWPGGAVFWWGAALIAWSGLTLLWGRDDGGRRWAFAGAACCTLGFWMALHLALRTEHARARLAGLLVAAGAIDAGIGIVRLAVAPAWQPPGEPLRLHGWGVTYHPVMGAAVLGVCCLTALDRAGRGRRCRSWYLAAAGVMAVAILLTRSRGPGLALLAGAVMLCVAGRARQWAPALLAVPAAAWLFGLVRGGNSGHFEVWRLAWAEIGRRPVLGYGLAADLPATLGADKRFPHDLYLSLLFYSGAAGLGLFVVWAGVIGWRLAGARQRAEMPWVAALWVNALVAGVTDFGQITKGPGPLWLIIWLPAALAGRLGAGTTANVAPERNETIDALIPARVDTDTSNENKRRCSFLKKRTKKLLSTADIIMSAG